MQERKILRAELGIKTKKKETPHRVKLRSSLSREGKVLAVLGQGNGDWCSRISRLLLKAALLKCLGQRCGMQGPQDYCRFMK